MEKEKNILENFTVVEITKSKGLPEATLTKSGLTFSTEFVRKMGNPENVKIMMNEKDKQIAIIKSESEATPFCRKRKSGVVRITHRDFIREITKMMEWDVAKNGYKIPAIWYQEENAMILELTKAKSKEVISENELYFYTGNKKERKEKKDENQT